jgi:hypothetical protein
MRFKILAFIWFAALAAAPITLSADDGCCDKPATTCCEKPAMTCCDKPATNAAPSTQTGCCDKADGHNHAAKAACCDGDGGCDMPCCKDGGECDMPCCQKDVAPSAVGWFFEMDGQTIQPTDNGVRQTAVVFFHRPVWVGDKVLMGKHIIEHDTGRQARGEPCTHIYAADAPKTPVATFHCTHLDADRADRDTVVLSPIGDGSQRFLQFQFKGETAAHGFPTER